MVELHFRTAKLLSRITDALGSFTSVVLATALIVVWALLGPPLQYSETWQLSINTTTTIVTFLMVFVVQHTQNRDGRAMQTKLDLCLEMLVSVMKDSDADEKHAPLIEEACKLVGIEDLPKKEIEREQQVVREQS